jgi:hypothetical protein
MTAPTKKDMRSLAAKINRGAPRPKCVNCGEPYGKRALETQEVRWDAPSKESLVYKGFGGSRDVKGFSQVAEIPPPPPYRGNGIVVKETRPYVSASDGRAVMTRHIWNGVEYWTPYEPFCTLRCALNYARRAFAKYGRVA